MLTAVSKQEERCKRSVAPYQTPRSNLSKPPQKTEKKKTWALRALAKSSKTYHTNYLSLLQKADLQQQQTTSLQKKAGNGLGDQFELGKGSHDDWSVPRAGGASTDDACR